MKTILSLFLMILVTGSVWATRPKLDSAAYAKWKRIDDYSISENGKWVKYRYAYINSMHQSENLKDVYYFYNVRTEKTKVFKGMESPNFFDGGNWISYTDITDSTKALNCLYNLNSGKKILWDRPGFPKCAREVPVVSYMSSKRRVFLNLINNDSVPYAQLGSYTLLNRGKKILYIYKGEDAFELRYGDLFAPENYKVLFTDRSKQLQFYKYVNGKGSFKLVFSEDDAVSTQFWKFDVNGHVALIQDTQKYNLPQNDSIDYSSAELLGDGTLIEFEGIRHRKSRKSDDGKKNTSFELELWSWNDEIAQSIQNVDGYRDPYVEPDKYIFNTKTNTMVKVSSDKNISNVYQPIAVPEYVLIKDVSAFKKRENWQTVERRDFYLQNLSNGEIKQFATEQTQQPKWSPDGKYVIYFDNSSQSWMRIDPRTFKQENMSSAIGYPVYNEMCDRPHPAGPYGLAGWSKDSKKVYVYDRYDIWRINMDDLSHPYCYTRGIGRKEGINIRFMDVNSSDALNIDESKTIYLTLWEHKTSNQGIARMVKGKLQKDILGPFSLYASGKSKDGSKILYSRQNFTEGRDAWVYDMKSHDMKRVSHANPNHYGYRWGSVKMIEWTNYAGKANQGLLYLPDDYDPAKEYPMVVNYYETHSNEMHLYHVPGWSPAMLDIPTFLSEGYIIFRPDVHFTIGNPTQSTYDAVVSGVEYLLKEGIAHKGHIGVQGHSWSGCTAAHLITMTDIFSAASIGAGVVNLTESYTSLRLGSGSPRMFMYEDWQCRIGKSLWEDPEAYIRNSAIFRADKIHTPVLIMHNDADEAVEYHEGRNFYFALRRLQRPVWLLNYKGEGHFIGNQDAQQDWSIRMLQFFDHYLKGAPAPRWMVEGININERGVDGKLDLVK